MHFGSIWHATHPMRLPTLWIGRVLRQGEREIRSRPPPRAAFWSAASGDLARRHLVGQSSGGPPNIAGLTGFTPTSSFPRQRESTFPGLTPMFTFPVFSRACWPRRNGWPRGWVRRATAREAGLKEQQPGPTESWEADPEGPWGRVEVRAWAVLQSQNFVLRQPGRLRPVPLFA